MKIGVDSNIDVESRLSKLKASQEVNSQEFNSLMLQVVNSFSEGDFDLTEIMSQNSSDDLDLDNLVSMLTKLTDNLGEDVELSEEQVMSAINDFLVFENENKLPMLNSLNIIQNRMNVDAMSKQILLQDEPDMNMQNIQVNNSDIFNEILNEKEISMYEVKSIIQGSDVAGETVGLTKDLVSIKELNKLVDIKDEVIYQKLSSSSDSLKNIGALEELNGLDNVETSEKVFYNNIMDLKLNNYNNDSKNKTDIIEVASSISGSSMIVNDQITLTPQTSTGSALGYSVITNQVNIVNAIKSKLQVSQNGELHKLTVRLHPESFGRINIELNMKDGIVSGIIRLSEEQAKAVFANNVDVIKNELSNQGIKIDNLDINLSNDNSGNTSLFQQDSFNQFRERRQQHNFGSRHQNREPEETIENIQRKKVNNIYREEGRVNLLI